MPICEAIITVCGNDPYVVHTWQGLHVVTRKLFNCLAVSTDCSREEAVILSLWSFSGDWRLFIFASGHLWSPERGAYIAPCYLGSQKSWKHEICGVGKARIIIFSWCKFRDLGSIFSRSKADIRDFAPWRLTKPLILGQIWEPAPERALKELSNDFLCGAVALLVPDLFASLSKYVEIGKIWSLMTSGDLTFALT